MAVMRARQDRLRGITRLHTPTTAEPLIVLVVDELAALTGWVMDRTAKRRIESALGLLLSQGRAVGVVVVGAVQDPRKETLPMRDLFPTRIALRLAEAEQVALVLGPGARNRGAVCDRIPDSLPGVGYVQVDGDRRTAAGPLRPLRRHPGGPARPPRRPGARAGDEGGSGVSVLDVPLIDSVMARELALAQRVCIRPLLRRVLDRETGAEDVVALSCGSTRDSVCPPCAHKARVLRMQQCAEGWHRADEPAHSDHHGSDVDDVDPPRPETAGDGDLQEDGEVEAGRRVRSTRRRGDVPDLPRVPVEARTVGRVFVAPDGREYRPSMFVTVTLPSYGPVLPSGAPRDPDRYDYRRAALDALHFARLVDRLWQNLRRCAGYRVQYFAAVEPQRRLAAHLHAALRGAIPRATLRRVIGATYFQLWWPAFDRPVYVHRLPVWNGADYVDRDTGEILPTWDEAVDRPRRRPGGTSGACDAVRRPGRPARRRRRFGRGRSGRALPDQVPGEVDRGHVHR